MDSFWSVANALKDAVKQQTAEITASLQNTDWKTEINALQEGLKEDTVEMSQKAKEVTEELGQKTIHVAKNLPQVVDEGRRKAVAQLEQLPGSSAARAKEAAAQLQQAGVSLSQMGHRVVANTSEMFDHFSNAIQAEMNAAQDRDSIGSSASSRSLNRGESSKFSRFDADVASMQRDSSTYCDEPDDIEDFEAWTAAFNLPGAKPDIAKILNENTFMSELQARIVPVVVDYESFWTRYFYRLHKLEEKHAKVAALASRAQIEEADLGWGDTDDEEEEEEKINVEENIVESSPLEDKDNDVNVQDNDEDQEEDEVEFAEEPTTAVPTENKNKNISLEVEESNSQLEKAQEDRGYAEVEPISSLHAVEVDASTAEAPLIAEEEEEEKEEEAVAVTDGIAKEKETIVAGESEKKKKTATKPPKDAVTDTKDEDEFSSLDFSGAEDLPEGEGDDDGSDWGDVAEWE